VDARVIPNGVDLDRFKPGSSASARDLLGLPGDADLLLFAASGLKDNRFKDYPTLYRALERLGESERTRPLVLVALGAEGPSEHLGRAEIRFVPYEREPDRVASYYRAADLYLHAAKADTFPSVVLEALACGTPVIATAIGGIPEQVYGIAEAGPDQATGALVPPGDSEGMAVAISHLLDDSALLRRLADNAAADAKHRFDLNRQADDYLAWYRERIEAHKHEEAAQ